jgi:putative acetyltransferase
VPAIGEGAVPVVVLNTPSLRRLPASLALRARSSADGGDLWQLFNERGFLDNALMRDPFSSAEEVNGWLDGVVASRRFEVVAVNAGHAVGFAALYGQRDHFEHCGLLMLGVSAALRGRGVGDLLLTALLATAREVGGFARLQLTVVADNAPAIALYRKHGFEFEGLHRRYARRDGRYLDAYSMARLLEPAAQFAPAAPERSRSGPRPDPDLRRAG